MVRLGIAGEGEDTLDVSVNVKIPGKVGPITGKNARTTRSDQVAKRRDATAPALPRESELRPVVEVTVAIIIESLS